jgi:hypothetical protein
LWDKCGDDIGHVGVIAHETGHFLGIPDLYDKDGGGKGLGAFCSMSNVWGFDGSQYYPGHMSAWAKMTLNWMQPVAPHHGVNIIDNAEEAATEHPQLYKIDAGFPSGEYLLIENRQQKGADKLLPHGGLAIYHIDEKADWDDEGYPGQSGWPGNGKHYKIALLQADGYYNLERGQNDGGALDFFFADGIGSLMPSTGDPNDGPFPNTDSYQGGKIKETAVEIFDISVSGDLMTFTYRDGNTPVTDPPSASPTQQPSSLPTKSPAPSAAPSYSSRFPTASPSLTHSALPTTTSQVPTLSPSSYPSTKSKEPSKMPSQSKMPSKEPSTMPSQSPSKEPSTMPSQSPSKDPSKMLVEQFYCRVLQRPAESDQVILGWIEYLQSNTVKDLVRFGILSDEFRGRFVNEKSAASQADTLYDVLLARPADSGGLVTWTTQISLNGWEKAVDAFLSSAEYIGNFGLAKVPGDGRAGCG